MVVLVSVIGMTGIDKSSDCNPVCGNVNISLNTGEASERMSLKTRKLTPSQERRIMSQSGLSNGAWAVEVFSSDMSMVEMQLCVVWGWIGIGVSDQNLSTVQYLSNA